jgi:hypothetical protein
MFVVRLFSVEKLLNVFLVLFPDIFLTVTYNFRGPNDYWHDNAFHIPNSLIIIVVIIVVIIIIGQTLWSLE